MSDDLSSMFDRAGGTFMGTTTTRDVTPGSVVIAGVPFDVGLHPFRVGARQGPSAIRASSRLLRRHLTEVSGDPLSELNVSDCGDVIVDHGDTAGAFRQIALALGPIAASDAIGVTMGGDGAVTLPQLRAVRERHGPIAVLHLDAHTDAYPGSAERRYDNGTTFTRATEEGLLDTSRTVHLGVRGTSFLSDVVLIARNLGHEVITGEDLWRRGVLEVAEYLCTRLSGVPVYLCWDMDIFDPAYAPGVASPENGGISAAEGILLLRQLQDLNLVWFDINTVSPAHDVANQTSTLAGRIILEFLFLAACRRRGQTTE